MYHNGMKLDSFLALNAVKQNEFAEKIGENSVCVNRYCLGTRIPRPEVMRKIYVATNGAVTPNDFYGLPDGTLFFANPPSLPKEEA